MNTEYPNSRQTTVVNALGMHARPAAKIAEMAQEANGDIWLSDGTSKVDATSIIDILTLCAVTGTKILIFTEKEEDIELADRIKAFFEIGFGENINE